VRRRDFLLAGIAYPLVTPNYQLKFPQDYGAHPDFRQEWWYVTGWLKRNSVDLGFQVTFFRARPDIESSNPSNFTPRQIILAHAALSDPRYGRLRVDERAARTALDLAGSREGTTNVWVDDWTLQLNADTYETRVVARDFSLELKFKANQRPLLQGDQGFSRKGRKEGEASYYYSQPQLAVTGKVDGEAVTGLAWLDHEWSSQYMASDATGWDWCGLNMNDGSALMAFRMRGANGETVFSPPGNSFEVLKTWKSTRSGATYPVSMKVNGYTLEPLMEDQEVDARASTGAIYWEGAVRALKNGREEGRGYLELTGYGKPMKL
jgi:predicted secreted hydrolase